LEKLGLRSNHLHFFYGKRLGRDQEAGDRKQETSNQQPATSNQLSLGRLYAGKPAVSLRF
jgi:hypothetical protein